MHDASASGYADGNLTNTGSAANSATGDDGDDAVAPASATRGPGTNKSSQANNPSAAQPGAPQTKDPVPIVSLSDAPQGVPAQTAVVTPVSLQPPPDRSTNIPAAPQKSIDHPSADQAAAQPATTGPQAPPPAPIGPVQAARIVSRAAQSEMRIGLNTPSFGSVEVRTVVHANDVGVLIGSERGDLKSLLATELPGVASNLQQHDLRLSQVSFHQGSGFFSQTPSGGGSQPRYFAPRANSAATLPDGFSNNDAVAGAEPRPSARGAGLSILA